METLNRLQMDLTNYMIAYWNQYSHFETWQFWFNVALLVLPLIAFVIFADRSRLFLVGFYGLNVHIWFAYGDLLGSRYAFWSYPYHIIPAFSASFSLDASLVPVAFMLTYQWSGRRGWKYYISMLAMSAAFAFAFKPLISTVDLFQLHRGTTYAHLFLIYVAVNLMAKGLTELFLRGERAVRPQP